MYFQGGVQPFGEIAKLLANMLDLMVGSLFIGMTSLDRFPEFRSESRDDLGLIQTITQFLLKFQGLVTCFLILRAKLIVLGLDKLDERGGRSMKTLNLVFKLSYLDRL